METFIKVLVKERLPEVCQHVIVGWDCQPKASLVAHISESGYWFLSYESGDCDEPDWWLEKIES